MPMEKTFNAAEAEARIYAAWEEAGAFKAGANASRDESFTIMIPPPNVTGSLHVGHAFNNTLQDILIRWKRMQGYDTLWQPGTDHAGIATQLVVERKLAEAQQPSRAEMGRQAFLAKVWEWKAESGGNIKNQLKRIGASCDWSREAFTMSGAPGAPEGQEGNFHDAVIKVFVEMYNKGLIYRGKRLVNWDPHFETAISDLEVENVEVQGHMWHFKYPLAGGDTYEYVEKDEDGNETLRETRDYISIATTRPETMLGDGAVAVHADDARYAPIVGKQVHLPLCDRTIPVITDEYPDPDFGSGAVKITGAHDFNDYGVAKRNDIALYSLMDTKGAMRADAAEDNLVPEKYRGMNRFDARKAVIADINAAGLAVMTTNEDGESVPYVENKPVMQPFGDRSKVVIEPMLTDQWFVDTDKIVGPALDAVRGGDVKIMPESGEKVFYHWLDNIEPWCISRQLWWGHQIPVWYDLYGNEFCAPTEDEAMEKAKSFHESENPGVTVNVEISDGFVLSQPDSAGRPQTNPPITGSGFVGAPETDQHSVGLSRDPDVLDTWFSSGLWPLGTLGWPEQTPEMAKYFPTGVLITGQDILFFWVARMMMMQQAVVGENPFHTVYLHQLVRDEKGEKMSKTRGNVIDPLVIVDEYGADALRFTMAQMAALGGVLKLSEDRIKGYRNFGTKLWNAFSFANHYEIAFTGDQTPPKPTQTLNKWIIGELAKARIEVDQAFESYRFNDAANALYAFTWNKLCDWYLEFSKPILQGDDAAAKAETEATLAWVLDQAVILLHPIMPFITEELWSQTAERPKMLIHADWPTYGAELVDAEADREMNWSINLIEAIRSARMQMHVPAGAKIPMLVSGLDAAGTAAWAQNEALIMRLARVVSLEHVESFPKGCVTVPVEGGTFAIPLAGVIDVDAEKARLNKSLEKLAKELGGLRGRLNNPKFAASAPEEVVAETRENLAAREDEEAKLREALLRMEELG